MHIVACLHSTMSGAIATFMPSSYDKLRHFRQKSIANRRVGSLNRQPVLIRAAHPEDHDAVWRILEPVIRAGETYPLPRDMTQAEAIAFWTGRDCESFVAEEDGRLLGTYYLRANQLGGGAHVANCGYVTASDATGRGIGRQMCEHSLEYARSRGFRAMQFNFVVSTNERAIHLWLSIGFETVGHLPLAFNHPTYGYVDAVVMFRTL
jgi:L-amino acid N-acyltransferase YncA